MNGNVERVPKILRDVRAILDNGMAAPLIGPNGVLAATTVYIPFPNSRTGERPLPINPVETSPPRIVGFNFDSQGPNSIQEGDPNLEGEGPLDTILTPDDGNFDFSEVNQRIQEERMKTLDFLLDPTTSQYQPKLEEILECMDITKNMMKSDGDYSNPRDSNFRADFQGYINPNSKYMVNREVGEIISTIVGIGSLSSLPLENRLDIVQSRINHMRESRNISLDVIFSLSTLDSFMDFYKFLKPEDSDFIEIINLNVKSLLESKRSRISSIPDSSYNEVDQEHRQRAYRRINSVMSQSPITFLDSEQVLGWIWHAVGNPSNWDCSTFDSEQNKLIEVFREQREIIFRHGYSLPEFLGFGDGKNKGLTTKYCSAMSEVVSSIEDSIASGVTNNPIYFDRMLASYSRRAIIDLGYEAFILDNGTIDNGIVGLDYFMENLFRGSGDILKRGLSKGDSQEARDANSLAIQDHLNGRLRFLSDRAAYNSRMREVWKSITKPEDLLDESNFGNYGLLNKKWGRVFH